MELTLRYFKTLMERFGLFCYLHRLGLAHPFLSRGLAEKSVSDQLHLCVQVLMIMELLWLGDAQM